MKQTTLVANGRLVLPDTVVENGGLYIEDAHIVDIGRQYGDLPSSAVAKQVIDAAGGYIMPGFIDLHSDAIEKEIEPRPKAYFPLEIAFRELEKKTAGQGVTTMFHSFSFADAEFGIRNDREAARAIRRIVQMAKQKFLIRSKIHLRYEITNINGLATVRGLLKDGLVDLLSVMDHTPGQGQFKTLESYQNYLQKTYHLHLSEADRILSMKEQARRQGEEIIQRLLSEAVALGIPTASHDDDDPARVNYYHNLGVTISDFPVSFEAAREAHSLKSYVCVGAPNVIRGSSQKNNLRAIDAIEAKIADILCSDYYPPSILHAVFLLNEELMTLPEAVRMATINPARAVGIDKELGSLEEGKLADIIVVQYRDRLPVVTQTIVNGRLTCSIDYQNMKNPGGRLMEQPA